MGKIEEVDFMSLNMENAKVFGFWREEHVSTILHVYLSYFKTEIIKDYQPVDMVIKGDKVMFKWKKRFEPLTEEEIKREFGR